MSQNRNRLFGLGVLVLSVAVVGTAAYGFVVNSDAAEAARSQVKKVAAAGAKTVAAVATTAAKAADVTSSCAAACGAGAKSAAVAAAAHGSSASKGASCAVGATAAGSASCSHAKGAVAAGPIDFAALGGVCASGATASNTSDGAACTLAPGANTVAATPMAPQGNLTGNFETAVAAACQGACAARIEYEAADVVHQPGAAAADLAQCPVSGVVFKVRANNATYVHDDETYYTCCGSCAGILSAKPSQFLKS